MPSFIQQLPAHIEATYGVAVKKLSPLEPWGPEGAQRVDLASGESWVARPHGPKRPVDAVRGDADILRFLEDHDFPAERVAHPEPVSTYGPGSVIVTKLLPGKNCREDTDPATLHGIGTLLGRLHTLPAADGAVSRPAGGWHHLSQAGGGRDEDVRILLPLLTNASQRLPADEQVACKELMVELESIDLCSDLPQCLINVDFGGPNIMKWRKKLSAVDWTGAGRGPRVHSLAALKSGMRNPVLTDALVAGYRDFVTLEAEELDRLGNALLIHGLVLNAWAVAFRGGKPSDTLRWLAREREVVHRIVERTRRAFESSTAPRWQDAPAPHDVPDADPAARPEPLQVLVDAVRGKSDAEITQFANGLGGLEQLCAMVVNGLATSLHPGDCYVGFVLGETMGWVIRSADGKVTTTKRVAKRAPAIVHMSPTDFLRITTRTLDWDAAVAEGRITVEGDAAHITTLFARVR